MLLWLRLGALAAALAPPQAPPATPLRRGFEVVATFDTSTLDGATRAPLALQVLDPRRFPTPSKAKRACRRAEVALNGRTARCGDDALSTMYQLYALCCTVLIFVLTYAVMMPCFKAFVDHHPRRAGTRRGE